MQSIQHSVVAGCNCTYGQAGSCCRRNTRTQPQCRCCWCCCLRQNCCVLLLILLLFLLLLWHSPLVCEGCVCQVQQVLNQQPVLHRHLQLDLCMDVIPCRRRGGAGDLLRRHQTDGKTNRTRQRQRARRSVQDVDQSRNRVAASVWPAQIINAPHG